MLDLRGWAVKKCRQLVVVAGLLFVAFGLGMWLGSRRSVTPKSPWSAKPASSAPFAHSAGELGPDTPPPCVDIRNAGPLVGKRGCVTGLVVRAFSARTGNTFLDFCDDYRSCPFTSVIFATDKDKFGDISSLQGKRVEIRGDVISYQDHAEIIIRDPQQVRSAP
jgi:hypothetical protein